MTPVESDEPEPCLIERSMMDDLLYIAEKLSDARAERNLHVAIVLGVLGSFDELSTHALEVRAPPAIPAFNPDLVELALQVAKSVLAPRSKAEDQEKELGKDQWAFEKERYGPITKIALSQGLGQPELVFDGANWHSSVLTTI